MKRRAFITTAAAGLAAGCTTGGTPADSTDTPQRDPVRNAEYAGLLDSHDGTNITFDGYSLHPSCQATIRVVFEEPPKQDAEIKVVFYRDGSEVDSDSFNVGDLDVGDRENVELKYCTYEKYDSFKLATV